jgi:hypothetical protein
MGQSAKRIVHQACAECGRVLLVSGDRLVCCHRLCAAYGEDQRGHEHADDVDDVQ